MPTWLQRQMQKAYYTKRASEIRMLNQLWFSYIEDS
ncbi:cortex morphogenetic protein CmpA [Salsuginibacillus kocurii]|nr:cortex morphogenetic protein CmpA [Salsuginibacillus kocurii]